jgi:hypothetical protein
METKPAVKHTPATPLPWTTLEDGRSRVKLVHVETTAENAAGAGLPVCSIPTARIGDAEYLTHTANAYPELVESGGDDGKAMIAAVDRLNNMANYGKLPPPLRKEVQEIADALAQPALRTRALLRSLGEVE